MTWWTPSTNNIEPSIANQVALGYFHNLDDNTYELSAEVYYKRMNNLVDYIDGADLLLNEFLEGDLLPGKGRAYGLELQAKKVKGNFTGWASYTLARTELLVEGVNMDEWYPSRFDQLHNFSLTGFYDLTGTRWSFSGSFVLNSGTPTTFPTSRIEQQGYVIPYNGLDVRNNVRIPVYHRLDLSATLGSKNKPGRRWKGEWVFSIYNVYNRRNPFSIFVRQDENRIPVTQPVTTEAAQLSRDWKHYSFSFVQLQIQITMRSLLYIIIAFAFLTNTACIDVVDIDLEEVPSQLVVDAWVNNRSEPQTIRLTMSQPYFDNSFTPGVDNATVGISDADGNIFLFESQGNGDYVWTPAPGETLGDVGTQFFLGVEWEGNVFSSATTMNRVPQVDSIVVEFREDELGFPDGHYAQFYARDFNGPGDTYWIKSFKNGVFLNKPFELNFAWDAAFAPGATDGLIFITPIREAINRFPDPDTDDDSDTPPWAPGDTVTVEIHSISQLAFDFLRIAREQMTNGSNTIFALPLANPRTNLVTVQGEQEAVGFFNVAAVSELSELVED